MKSAKNVLRFILFKFFAHKGLQLLNSQCMHAQLCLTLCDPMDCSPTGSSVHGIFQAKHWGGLTFPSPGVLPDPRIKTESPTLQADSLPSESPGLPEIAPTSKMPLELYLQGSANPDLTSSLAWVSTLSPDWRMCVSHALHYRKCECSHFHRCSQDRATSGPMFPCHKEEGCLQIQMAKIRGVLAGGGCLSCFHGGKSGKKK